MFDRKLFKFFVNIYLKKEYNITVFDFLEKLTNIEFRKTKGLNQAVYCPFHSDKEGGHISAYIYINDDNNHLYCFRENKAYTPFRILVFRFGYDFEKMINFIKREFKVDFYKEVNKMVEKYDKEIEKFLEKFNMVILNSIKEINKIMVEKTNVKGNILEDYKEYLKNKGGIEL